MENIELIQQILRRCSEVKLTPLLWGKHGIGKSAIVRQLFEADGYEVIDLRLGQLEVGDLIGHPASSFYCPKCGTRFGFATQLTNCPICEQRGATIPIVGEMTWLPPSWFPQNGEKRCFFFDEFNRGRLDVQQAAFQIVLDHRIHVHKIPDNCMIVCACNPPPSGSDKGVEYNVEELDPALLDRFVNIKFNLTTTNWLKWARERGIMQDIIDFVATEEKFLGNNAIDIPIDITPSPRSYEFLSKLLSGKTIARKYWMDVAETVIGSTAAVAFVNSLKTDFDRPIKAQEIFDNFAKIRGKVMAQIEKGDDGKTRFDLLRITLDEIGECLGTEDKARKYTDKQFNNLGDFLTLLPEDLAFSAFKDFAANSVVNERLLIKRPDLFNILKRVSNKAREGG